MTADPRELRRLRKRSDFLRAARGMRAGRSGFSLQAIENAAGSTGIGFTVSKKAGNAPQRNRIRRRLKAAVEACSAEFDTRHDYVLVGRPDALSLPFATLVGDLSALIRRVHVPRPKPAPQPRAPRDSMTNNRNMILAIALSLLVLLGWQYLVVDPQLRQAQRQAEIAAQQQAELAAGAPAVPGVAEGAAPGTPAAAAPTTVPGSFATRADALNGTPRVRIDTPAVKGSLSLVGARIDDLELKGYRETIDPDSPIITLLSPLSSEGGYFVEQGFAPQAGVKLPDATTQWSLEGDAATTVLTPASPVTLSWDNGAGLVFRRTIAVDEHYLFTVTQSVENTTAGDVALYPYAQVSRHGTPKVQNFFIQHEGPLGVLGSNNLILKTYGQLQGDRQLDFTSNGGWLGIGDKYWATTVLSKPQAPISARFSWVNPGTQDIYRTSFVETAPLLVPAGQTVSNETYVFAGAKEEAVIASYEQKFGFDRLEMLIDWGWFAFLTKPMFYLLTWFNGLLGNFGLAILAVTVLVKAVLFPLANRSYASMAAMRRVQPQMKLLQDRLKDDRVALQQEMMALYRKEKINPLSGCWPILIQIPVFFALYTVLFISLDMRHAPFFGWIRDLAAPDPTNIFTLFGLIPWDPVSIPLLGAFLHLGIWPVIMGITMWVQMRLNPPPPDPTQAMIFNWMPVVFTFMLGSFPAGLVIYWAWNNTLSVIQQYVIMKRHGADVNLFGNIAASFRRQPKPQAAATPDKGKGN